MISAIAKLVSLGSEALCSRELAPEDAGPLLLARNGFYAFEGALLVRPYSSGGGVLGVREWNDATLWRQNYQELAMGLWFFAEDVFGCQFCTRDGRICTFDPESGETDEVAHDLEEWARSILENYAVLTGHPIAKEWQRRYGRLAPGRRLIPKQPFVLGGPVSVDNLYDCCDVEGMRARADLAIQIRDVPDGTAVNYRVVD